MNILYLLKTLDTKKLSELVANIDAPPLDVNLAIWEAIDRGEIEIDEEKDRIKVLKTWEIWKNDDLANKLIRVIQHYAKNGVNVTRGRLKGYIKDPLTEKGYPYHEYIMSLQALIDEGTVVEETISVPKTGKRPYQKFVFLCLPENDNSEMNAKAINKWIAEFDKSKVK